jgi:transcriptional regulator with XRE-family HTH domain
MTPDAKKLAYFERALHDVNIAAQSGEMRQLPLPLIAEGVRHQRSIRGWKQSSLATIAGVSTSSIQRIERDEYVRPEILAKIERALDLPEGTYSAARILPTLDSLKVILERQKSEEQECASIPVKQLLQQVQVAQILKCRALVTNEDSASDAMRCDIAALRRMLNIDGVRIAVEDVYGRPNNPSKRTQRRNCYKEVISLVERLNRKHSIVTFAGTYLPKMSGVGIVETAVISFLPKAELAAILRQGKVSAPKMLPRDIRFADE